jgi:hypothetical protein
MILTLSQTAKDLVSGQFVILRGQETVGEISFQGKLYSMEAAFHGRFYHTEFEMRRDRRCKGNGYSFRPYFFACNGRKTGNVYQTRYRETRFHPVYYHTMVKDGQTYDLFPISFGREGARSPLYCGDQQIAQIEKSAVTHNDLHQFRIFAADEEAAFTAVLFGLYLYVLSCYRPGEKVSRSISKVFSTTKERSLLSKYDPHFTEHITE